MSSIKFAIFTDNHLGYEETDPIIGKDSFVAFEEALNISLEEKVDCILHAGDLFNDQSPSRSTIIKTNEILHKYLFRIPNEESQGENAIRYADTDGLTEPIPTTMDENIRVKVPLFLIHGNHDQPSGFQLTSAVDLLSSCRLVNYFKKIIDPVVIELKPVIMERNNIVVAIYGLGYIMETKFIAALESKSVTFAKRPDEQSEENTNEGDSQKRRFNILLLHQNRPSRNSQQLQVPHMLHEICPWMDLIIWGHEHENRAEIEICCGMKITQPGSTVVTQLREYEATPRGMAILEIFHDSEEFVVKRLKTNRPFIVSKLELDSTLIGKPGEEVLAVIREKLNDMIDQRDDRNKVPIIRLNIVASIDMRNVPYKQLTYEFSHQVANPHNFIDISRRSTKSTSQRRNLSDQQKSDQAQLGGNPEGNALDFTTSPNCVENLLEKKFEGSPLDFLIVDTLNQSLKSFVFEEDKDSFNRNIKDLITTRVGYLVGLVPEDASKGMSPEDAAEFIDQKRKDLPGISSKSGSRQNSQQQSLAQSRKKKSANNNSNSENDDDNDGIDDDENGEDDENDGGRKPGKNGRNIKQQKRTTTRKTKTVHEEPIEQEEMTPAKTKMPRRVRAPPSVKKSVSK